MLRAIATPIESAPAPRPPPAIASDAETMVATIPDVDVAVMLTPAALVTSVVATMYAFVRERMTFVASAPAPLAAPPPKSPPTAADAETAIDSASMVTAKTSNVPDDVLRMTYAREL